MRINNKLVLSFLFILAYCFTYSQNLIQNNSFELLTSCPNSLGQINLSIGWNSYGETPDYLNKCATSPNVDIPSNFLGFQNSISPTDNAYCALATYSQGVFGREYIGSQLVAPLQIGQEYYFSLKTSAASNGSSNFQCYTDKLGVLFSTVPYSSSSPAPTNNFAHIYSNAIISDTLNWVTISGSFIADSNYNYVIVGNFFNDVNTDTLECSGSYAYYYIDELCLSNDSTVCDMSNGIPENEEALFEFYPNPVINYLNIVSTHEMNFNQIQIKIYNSVGEEILIIDDFDTNKKIDFSIYPSGIYFVYLQQGNKITLRKIINP